MLLSFVPLQGELSPSVSTGDLVDEKERGSYNKDWGTKLQV
jgi:hypothetical protein